MNGSTPLGTGTLSGTTATLTLTSPAAGSYSIKANYGGDANYVAATSTAASVTVSKAAQTITFTLPSTGAGAVKVTANQAGNSNYLAASAVAQTVNVSKAATTVNLTVSPSSSTIATGTSITFTAALTNVGAAPTGTVTFMDGKTQLGTGKLSSGTATYTTTKLTAGAHSITASYGGDSNYLTGTSSAVSFTVGSAK
jgi:plastocyanin